MSLYTRAAATSLRLLTTYGQDVTHRTYTTGTYDPATGTTTPVTADTTRKGALFDYGANTTTVRGQLVQVSDRRLLLDASAAVSVQDRLIVGGVEYMPVSVDEISPAGTRVLFDIHVRVGA